MIFRKETGYPLVLRRTGRSSVTIVCTRSFVPFADAVLAWGLEEGPRPRAGLPGMTCDVQRVVLELLFSIL